MIRSKEKHNKKEGCTLTDKEKGLLELFGLPAENEIINGIKSQNVCKKGIIDFISVMYFLEKKK